MLVVRGLSPGTGTAGSGGTAGGPGGCSLQPCMGRAVWPGGRCMVQARVPRVVPRHTLSDHPSLFTPEAHLLLLWPSPFYPGLLL